MNRSLKMKKTMDAHGFTTEGKVVVKPEMSKEKIEERGRRKKMKPDKKWKKEEKPRKERKT